MVTRPVGRGGADAYGQVAWQAGWVGPIWWAGVGHDMAGQVVHVSLIWYTGVVGPDWV